MPKDIILEIKKINNPSCLLANGKRKDYSCLTSGDKVLVRNLLQKHPPFIEGEILEYRMPRKVWVYKVQTKNGISFLYPSDFKCFKPVEKSHA